MVDAPRDLTEESERLVALARGRDVRFPVRRLRWFSQQRLDPGAADYNPPPQSGWLSDDEISESIDRLVDAALGTGRDAILGFPSSGVVLLLQADRFREFLAFSRQRPIHDVVLHVDDETDLRASWSIVPSGDQDAYRLRFSLPREIADRVEEIDEAREQIRAVKNELGGSILVVVDDGDDELIVRLKLSARGLRR